MNSATPAYSVVAFLLILGSTLLAMPMSVLSQSDSETPLDGAVVQGDAPTDTIEKSIPAINFTIQDSYSREDLPTKEVFSDFVVGPGRVVMELAPGESKTIELVISNRMGVTKRFNISPEDTAGTSDPEIPLVLLGEERGPYTLKDYISVPNFQFDLEHAKRVRIPVTVTLPLDAPAGGKYGSLLVSIVSSPNDTDDSSGAASASVIISRIGVLFFVSNPGDTTPEAKLTNFSTIGDEGIYSKGPISFGITHENTGQVHVTPYGEIRVTNMLGDEVGFVKLDPWFVLPQALRTREVSWDRELLIGRYTATAYINRGYDNIIDEVSVTFWVLPWKIFAGVFAGLFIFFLFIRFIVTRFEFKRK